MYYPSDIGGGGFKQCVGQQHQMLQRGCHRCRETRDTKGAGEED